MLRPLCLLAALAPLTLLDGAAPPPRLKTLFDFEDADALEHWSNLELPKSREPAVGIARSTEHATNGKHSLKLTFAGGTWPTITTARVLDTWAPFRTFRADVTVSRPCVVGFTVLQEKSVRGTGWDANISRWTKTAFLKPGLNHVTAFHKAAWSKPTPRTVAGVEADMRKKLAALKDRHPRAVLSTLRDGEKGFDPARPDAVFAG